MKDAARSGGTGGAAQFRGDRLDAKRFVTHNLSAELVDGAAQRAGQRTPKIGHADPDDPLVGFNLQGDDRARCIRVFRGVGERLVGRQGDDLRANTGNLHRITIPGRDQGNILASPMGTGSTRVNEKAGCIYGPCALPTAAGFKILNKVLAV